MVGKRKIPEAFFKRTFDKGDLNKDGVLEGIELDKAFLSEENFAGAKFDTPSDKAGDQSIHAVRAGGRGDVTKTHRALEARRLADRPHRLAAGRRRPHAAGQGRRNCDRFRDRRRKETVGSPADQQHL